LYFRVCLPLSKNGFGVSNLKLFEIAELVKEQTSADIIAIQCGFYFNFYNEDAQLLSDTFSLKTYKQGPNLLAGVPVSARNSYIEKFTHHNLRYVVLEQVKSSEDDRQRLRKISATNIDIRDKEQMVFPFQTKEPRSKTKLNKTFLQAIMEGINPETGEVLSEDSAWRHPKIIEDIATYIDYGAALEESGNRKKKTRELKFSSSEFTIFCEAMQKIDQIIPRLSERKADIIRFHYDPKQTELRTLQETANKFGISRERVRQIKEKTLRVMRSRVKKTQFIPPSKTVLGDEKFSKKIANEYLKDLLNSLVEEGTKDRSQKITERINPQSFGNPRTKFLDGDYFRFETLDKFTRDNINHEFWKSQKLDKEYINSKREENLRNGRLLNHGFPIVQEERAEILKCHRHNWTIEEIEFFFQRSRISIEIILEKHGET
jgi:hypothetical protein